MRLFEDNNAYRHRYPLCTWQRRETWVSNRAICSGMSTECRSRDRFLAYPRVVPKMDPTSFSCILAPASNVPAKCTIRENASVSIDPMSRATYIPIYLSPSISNISDDRNPAEHPQSDGNSSRRFLRIPACPIAEQPDLSVEYNAREEQGAEEDDPEKNGTTRHVAE